MALVKPFTKLGEEIQRITFFIAEELKKRDQKKLYLVVNYSGDAIYDLSNHADGVHHKKASLTLSHNSDINSRLGAFGRSVLIQFFTNDILKVQEVEFLNAEREKFFNFERAVQEEVYKKMATYIVDFIIGNNEDHGT